MTKARAHWFLALLYHVCAGKATLSRVEGYRGAGMHMGMFEDSLGI